MAPDLFDNRRRGLSYALVPGSEGAEGSASARICKVLLTLVTVLAITIATVVFCRVYLGPVLQWLMELGGWQGPVLYGGLIVVSAIPPMWGYMVLNVGAGYIYGVVRGTALTSVSALAGSLLAMVLCRYALTSCTQKMLKSFSNLAQLARLMEGDQGLKIVMMTRLTPVPFGIQNALFSATNITFVRFGMATFLALLPTQLLNSYLGTTLRSLDEVVKGNSNAGMMVAQVVMMVWVTWYVNRRMKREIAVACERDAMARASGGLSSLSGGNNNNNELLDPLMEADRGSVGTPGPEDGILDGWNPFDLAMDGEPVSFTAELQSVSVPYRGSSDSSAFSVPVGDPFSATTTTTTTTAHDRNSGPMRSSSGGGRNKGHRRSMSADMHAIRVDSRSGSGAVTSVATGSGTTPPSPGTHSATAEYY
eukprot:m.192169 g.192169  ORF g.192169 m.192169 type:complete len:421 (+) comp18584_c0_seq1:210-1472(+)